MPINLNELAKGIKIHKKLIIKPEIRATFFGENNCINLGATTIVNTDPIEKITKMYPKPVYSTPI